jgi:putative addiction module killer protein
LIIPPGKGISSSDHAHHGPGYRVYYSKTGNTVVLLLIGGDKRRQQADIETALAYLADWKRRNAR